MKVSAKDLRAVSSTLNVLYAEDEAILRDAMQSSLEKLFAKVYTAKNGQEAFELFKKEDIDILITDINMPIMSGMELIDSINRHTEEEPKIVVLSAHNESRLLTNLINMGVNNFLNKPVDKQMMVNVLFQACKSISDQKWLLEYQVKLEEELESTERKNKILEQKLNQLAFQVNKNETLQMKETPNTLEKVQRQSSDYYENLLMDDKDELQELAHELDSFIAMLFQADGLNKDYLQSFSYLYKKYASILNSYLDFADIAVSLTDFANTILSLEDKFMKDLQQTGIYFESLQITLENFRQNVWIKEAQNPMFYNASLKMDVQLIIDFLEEKEIQDNEIEFF